MRNSFFPLLKNAPLLTGAFFLFLLSSACKEKSSQTANWITSEPTSEASTPESSHQNTDSPSTPPSKSSTPAPATLETSEEEIRFLSYNLKNYLTMRRGKEYLPKPEDETKALIELIVRQKPDILGLCEIGNKNDLADLQLRLKNAGLDLPYSEHTGGRDKTRHLGFLSRHPIIATNSQSELSYEMEGKEWLMSRGILDATIETQGIQLRFLGVHLKSKRLIEEADQELIRQNEARLLRTYADTIFNENPDTLLLAYGDFNDTISSKTLSIAKARRNAKKHLADFYFKDSRNELWTHFWDRQDTYSRLDYVLFSKALSDHLVGKKSSLVDDPSWNIASDHRALMLVLKP